jgi:hypothetical protein
MGSLHGETVRLGHPNQLWDRPDRALDRFALTPSSTCTERGGPFELDKPGETGTITAGSGRQARAAHTRLAWRNTGSRKLRRGSRDA